MEREDRELLEEVRKLREDINSYEQNLCSLTEMKSRLARLESMLGVESEVDTNTAYEEPAYVREPEYVFAATATATDKQAVMRENINRLGTYGENQSSLKSQLKSVEKEGRETKETSEGNIENNIGTTVMSILASLLIFLGICSIGALVYDSFTDELKAIAVNMISLGLLVAGYWRLNKHQDIFANALTATGIGSAYIAFYLDYELGVMPLELSLFLMLIFGFVVYYMTSREKSALLLVICFLGYDIASCILIHDIDTLWVYMAYAMQLVFCLLVMKHEDWKKGHYYTIAGLFNYLCLTISMFGVYDRYDYYGKTVDLLFVALVYAATVAYGIYTFTDLVKHVKTAKEKSIAYFYSVMTMVSIILPVTRTMYVITDKLFDIYCLHNIFTGLFLLFVYYYMVDQIEEKLEGIRFRALTLITAMITFGYFMFADDTYMAILIGSVLMLLPIYSFAYVFTETKDSSYRNIASLTWWVSTCALVFHIMDNISYDVDKLGQQYALGVGVFFVMLAAYGILSYLQKDVKACGSKIVQSLNLMFGYFWVVNYFYELEDRYTSSYVDRLPYSLATVIGFTAIILFVTCTGYAAKVSRNYFRRLRLDEEQSVVYYVFRFISYFVLGYLLYAMYDNYEWSIGFFIAFLCSLVLVMSGTRKTYHDLKSAAGFILGMKFTIYTWSILHIFLQNVYVDIGFMYSLVFIVIAIISILLGFRYGLASFRYYGLTLSIISVLKFVLIDITYNNSIFRIISYMVGGVLCLGIVSIYNSLNETQGASGSLSDEGLSGVSVGFKNESSETETGTETGEDYYEEPVESEFESEEDNNLNEITVNNQDRVSG